MNAHKSQFEVTGPDGQIQLDKDGNATVGSGQHIVQIAMTKEGIVSQAATPEAAGHLAGLRMRVRGFLGLTKYSVEPAHAIHHSSHGGAHHGHESHPPAIGRGRAVKDVHFHFDEVPDEMHQRRRDVAWVLGAAAVSVPAAMLVGPTALVAAPSVLAWRLYERVKAQRHEVGAARTMSHNTHEALDTRSPTQLELTARIERNMEILKRIMDTVSTVSNKFPIKEEGYRDRRTYVEHVKRELSTIFEHTQDAESDCDKELQTILRNAVERLQAQSDFAKYIFLATPKDAAAEKLQELLAGCTDNIQSLMQGNEVFFQGRQDGQARALAEIAAFTPGTEMPPNADAWPNLMSLTSVQQHNQDTKQKLKDYLKDAARAISHLAITDVRKEHPHLENDVWDIGETLDGATQGL